MKRRFPTDRYNVRLFIIIFLVLISIFNLNGCLSKTLQPAKDDDTKETKEDLSINKIVSVFKRQNGDIYICVELNEKSCETSDLKFVTITISPKNMIGGTYAIERRGAPSEVCLSDDTAELVLPGARTVGLIPFEKIRVEKMDGHQLYVLLDKLSQNQPESEMIFQVNFIPNAEDTKTEVDAVLDEVPKYMLEGPEDILLIYWPSRLMQEQDGIKPTVLSIGKIEEEAPNSGNSLNASFFILTRHNFTYKYSRTFLGKL